MSFDPATKLPSRQDSTSSRSSTSSTKSNRSCHIVYNPWTFKLRALKQDEFDRTEGLIETCSPGRSLDAPIYMNVGSGEKPVQARYATVDVGKLGWRVSVERLLGMHEEIYVQA